jgi:hypothetical protein
VGNSTVRANPGINPTVLRATLQAQASNVKDFPFILSGTAPQNLTTTQAKRQWDINNIIKGGKWVSNASNTAWFLTNNKGLPIVDAQGNKFQVTENQVLNNIYNVPLSNINTINQLRPYLESFPGHEQVEHYLISSLFPVDAKINNLTDNNIKSNDIISKLKQLGPITNLDLLGGISVPIINKELTIINGENPNL